MMILNILKIGFIIGLLFMFFKLFGQESIVKFLAKQTIVVESSKDYTAADRPAITVCAVSGWRKSEDMFRTICNSSANAKKAYQCIKNSTFDLSEMVNLAMDENQNIIDNSHWQLEISKIDYGKCFTLNSSVVKIGTDVEHKLTIYFTKNIGHYSLIHDPNFFIPGPNPETMPRIFTIHDASFGTQLMYMKTIEHVKMNLPAKPCQEEESYSLTRCIRDSINRKIGCRPEWDNWRNQGRPICKEMQQLLKYNNDFNEIASLVQGDIANHTGCLLPCRYKEYEIVDTPILMDPRDKIQWLVRSNKNVLVKTEHLVYPFSSFLAEFGGALGLFLGFSFFMAWDFL